MIKSKLDARERAIELAIAYYHGIEGNRALKVLETAKSIENYIVGNAELPEVVDDNALLKELFDVAQREMEKINKRDDFDYDRLLKTLQRGNTGIVDVPCKSDADE